MTRLRNNLAIALAISLSAFVAPAAAQWPMVPSGGGGGSVASLPPQTPTLVNQAYTTQSSDLGKVLTVSNGPGNALITLMSASIAGNGAVQYVQKNDNSPATVVGSANNGSGAVRLTVASSVSPATSAFLINNVSGTQQYTVNGVGGTVEANGTWPITVIDGTHVDLVGSTWAGNAWTSGGSVNVAQIIVNDGSTNRAVLQTLNDFVGFRSNGSTWTPIGWQIYPVFRFFAANGTWPNDPLSTRVALRACGPGGSGASGRRGALASIRTGGTGGTGGVFVNMSILTALLNATEPVVVPAGAAGGIAQTVDSTGGVNGNGGGNVTFGSSFLGSATWLIARGGTGGNGGGTASVTGPTFAVTQYTNDASPGPGGGSLASGTSSGGITSAGEAGGGGGGGGATAANAAVNPAAGGGGISGLHAGSTVVAGGTAGAPTGGPGTNNTGSMFFGGAGGGAGGWVTAQAGASGGAGGIPCGGGGGGSASDNLFTSGPGGASGRGELQAVTFF